MSGFSSSRDQLLSSLKSYNELLKARQEALSQISKTSTELRSALQDGNTAGVDIALQRRDQDCTRLAPLCRPGIDEDAIIDAVKRATTSANDELGRLSQVVLTLHEDSHTLTQDILACQAECENLLKNRIESVGAALKQSSQRRKLNATYGPAHKHEVPVFLDKQR